MWRRLWSRPSSKIRTSRVPGPRRPPKRHRMIATMVLLTICHKRFGTRSLDLPATASNGSNTLRSSQIVRRLQSTSQWPTIHKKPSPNGDGFFVPWDTAAVRRLPRRPVIGSIAKQTSERLTQKPLDPTVRTLQPRRGGYVKFPQTQHRRWSHRVTHGIRMIVCLMDYH